MKIITEILQKYHSEIVDHNQGDYWFAVQKAGAYKVGDYSNFKVGSFSLKKALDSMGVQELKWEDFDTQGDAPVTALGVSRLDLNKFAIREVNSVWEFSVIHEAGHLVLKHGGLSFIDLIMGKKAYFELEAELFSYMVFKKLGKNFPESSIKLMVNNVYLLKNHLEQSQFKIDENYINSKADEFLRLGGWTK
jgi:hypothetical protein